MSDTIWKFTLELKERQAVEMPMLSHGEPPQLLTIDMQHNELCLWAKVRPGSNLCLMSITLVGTGHEIPHNAGDYIATVQDGSFVWHFFGRMLRS